MSSYTHLTQIERYHISVLYKRGKSLSFIADKLNRSKSTISRELQRNSGFRGYRPEQAHEQALYRLKTSHKYMVGSSNKCNLFLFIKKPFAGVVSLQRAGDKKLSNYMIH